MEKKIAVGLCEGRHPLPVQEYVFGEVIDSPMDYESVLHGPAQATPDVQGDRLRDF